MHIKTKSPIGPIAVIVREKTKQRLFKTCFRGRSFRRAGNFCLWNNVYEVLSDAIVFHELIADACEAFAEGSLENSVCIRHDSIIGWSGTDELAKYKPDDLEEYFPNRRSQALRVKTNRTDLTAPPTKFLTLAYELRIEDGQIALIVHSMYPGEDIGKLVGNITETEECVFFDWNHLGQPVCA
ncbi:MAG: hypothetical protein AAB610_00290 [Patescibacteria group bacterium]